MAKTTINIEIRKPDDTPEEGYIFFKLATADSLGGIEYSDRTPIRVNLNASGIASIQLQPNDDAGWSITGNSYLVEERFSGKAKRQFYMVVPTSASPVDYADLATYANAPSISADIDLAAEFAAFEAVAEVAYRRGISVKEHGAVGDGTTDDTAAIQAALSSVQAGTVGVRGGVVYFPPGEYRITSSLTMNKWTGVLRGNGTGNSPAHGSAGQASVIRWDGNNSTAMFVLTDYREVTFEHLRLEGNDASKPTYAIQSAGLSSYSIGTNAQLKVKDCYIGSYTWSTQGTEKGDMAGGVGFTGDNANNDQFVIENSTFSHCDTALYVPNTQSIWGTVKDTVITTCTVAGIRTKASMTLVNIQFDNCAIDLWTEEAARVNAFGWWSERSGLIMQNDTLGRVNVFGGLWTLTSPYMSAGANLLVHDTATAGAGVSLRNVSLVNQTGGAHPKIYVRAEGGGGSNPGYLRVENCGNLTITEFNVASTVSDSLEVWVETGTMSVHQSLLNAQTFTGTTSDGTWTAYTPTLSGTGWALGNATIVGSWVQIGKTIHCRGRVAFGSTSTYGSAAPALSLPATGKSNDYPLNHSAMASGGGATKRLVCLADSPATKVNFYYGDSFTTVDSTTPITWATGYVIYFDATYEAA